MNNPIRLSIALAIAVTLGVVGSGCSSKARHMTRADRYFAAGEYSKAEIEYVVVLQKDHGNTRAYGQLGAIFLEEGRAPQAFYYLSKALEANTNDLNIRVKIATVYLAAGMTREARSNAMFVLERKADDPMAPLVLADTASSQADIDNIRKLLKNIPAPAEKRAALEVAVGNLDMRQFDFRSATAEFEHARSLDPKMASVYAGLGTVYWAQNDLKRAEETLKMGADLAPSRSPLRLRYAQFKLRTGDVAGGRTYLEEMTKKTPDYLSAWQMLAEVYAAEKKMELCGAAVARVLALNPQNFEALMMQARLKLENADPAQAVAAFENIAKGYDKNAQVHYQLGLAYRENHEFGKAIASFTRAATLQPTFSEAVLALNELRIKMGDLESAATALTQFVKQQPKSSQAQLLLADAYRLQGKFDETLKVYRNLQELFPTNAMLPSMAGLIYVQQKKYGEARKSFEAGLTMAPDSELPLAQLVDLDLIEKKPEDAVARLEKELQRNPSVQSPRVMLSKVYIQLGKTNEAEATLMKAIEAQPDLPAAYLVLSQLYVSAKQYDKALSDLDKILAKNPKDQVALMRKGMIQDLQQKYPAARDSYESVLAENPRFSSALNNLAYLYSEKLNQQDKAYEMARRARDLMPVEPSTADTLGWICYKRGDYSRALSLLEESASRLGSVAEVQYHLGMANYMMGEEADAHQALQLASQSKDEFTGKDTIPARLAVLAVDPRTADANVRADLEKKTSGSETDPIALVRLAAIYERDGALDKALANYTKAAAFNPKNVEALINQARLLALNPQTFSKGFDLAKEAYKMAPENPYVASTLGRMAYQNRDYRWSLSVLQPAAAKQPNQADLQYDLAEALYSVGQGDEAEATMRRALKTNPNFPRAAEAKRFLDLISTSTPNVALASDVLKTNGDYLPALVVVATESQKKSDLVTARQGFEKILAQYPDFGPAKKQLSILYADDATSDDKKAYTLTVSARELYPNDPGVARALGIMSYRQGEFSGAERLLKETLARSEKDAKVAYYLGMAQSHLKKPTESKKNLQRALDLNLPEPLAAEAKKTIAQLK